MNKAVYTAAPVIMSCIRSYLTIYQVAPSFKCHIRRRIQSEHYTNHCTNMGTQKTYVTTTNGQSQILIKRLMTRKRQMRMEHQKCNHDPPVTDVVFLDASTQLSIRGFFVRRSVRWSVGLSAGPSVHP